jgi:hypothetical protein
LLHRWQITSVLLGGLTIIGLMIATERYWLRGSLEPIKRLLRPSRKMRRKPRPSADWLTTTLTGERVGVVVLVAFAISALASNYSVYHVTTSLFKQRTDHHATLIGNFTRYFTASNLAVLEYIVVMGRQRYLPMQGLMPPKLNWTAVNQSDEFLVSLLKSTQPATGIWQVRLGHGLKSPYGRSAQGG